MSLSKPADAWVKLTKYVASGIIGTWLLTHPRVTLQVGSIVIRGTKRLA